MYTYDIQVHVRPMSLEALLHALEMKGIQMNEYARTVLTHRMFSLPEKEMSLPLRILDAQALGLPEGAVYERILSAARDSGLSPCPLFAAPFLRLQYDEPVSANSVLTGLHQAPEGSITVISPRLELRDDFPRGLYLRNVDGTCWLRGYTCDDLYVWPPEARFAFAFGG